ncbi:hypothetical protein SAMN04515647_2043 [Cohaesibacter sp. ES.047]|nr:hypothetical protein SAMN04515647_2043 [Cohaesibacter sp. ES.047]
MPERAFWRHLQCGLMQMKILLIIPFAVNYAPKYYRYFTLGLVLIAKNHQLNAKWSHYVSLLSVDNYPKSYASHSR